jgi:tetratricopeptide (TPR) repeat protein
MNKGLPSLLDAIFGKSDLALVSLDEVYEVISEFPSFNAAHFLLSKKLKESNDPDFEKQSMRTALYFNNALWLQTLLDEGNKIRSEKPETFTETRTGDHINGQDRVETESHAVPTIRQEEEIAELPIDKNADLYESTNNYNSYSEPVSTAVTSFDELLSKYKIEPDFLEVDKLKEEKTEHTDENTDFISTDKPNVYQDEPVRDSNDHYPVGHREETITFISEEEDITPAEGVAPEEPIFPANQDKQDNNETKHEILNEYGIFEEVVVNKSDADLDLEAFDRPIESIVPVSEPAMETNRDSYIPVHAEIPAMPEVPASAEEIPTPAEFPAPDEIPAPGENSFQPDSTENTDVHDYEAFDRPIEKSDHDEQEDHDYTTGEEIREISEPAVSEIEDEIKPATPFSGEYENGMTSRREATEGGQEAEKKVPVFDPNKTESIVFAPYHMIDYFASQGIKLVLEDNPPDHFSQQLKSFTDWLKVMKRLPLNQQSLNTDEKETDRIRHFAAHSIEDRDVLTESMAEVLAKQGMYENAIALYQKLSLIYPPKSAYFASRIEQLKAFLP